jgi:hypothetical protein
MMIPYHLCMKSQHNADHNPHPTHQEINMYIQGQRPQRKTLRSHIQVVIILVLEPIQHLC